MSSILYSLLFIVFFTILQTVSSKRFYGWNVERSSVNPLSYTDETHYSRERTESTGSSLNLRCPDNEHFSRCDSNCQVTCKNYKKPSACAGTPCSYGCVCNSGLVRGPDERCIQPSECPDKSNAEAEFKWCEEHEIYDLKHAHCQRNCSNYDDVLYCKNEPVSGCVCDYAFGYVREPKGKCIKIKECPKKPHKYSTEKRLKNPEINSNLYVTLNPPPYTDDDYHIPSAATKVPPYSETENPQFEETEPNPTDPPHNCPKDRPRWVPCAAHCQRNCNNKDDEEEPCRPVCVPGCICKEGFVEGPDGKCIEKDKCPRKSDSKENVHVTLNPPPYTNDDYHIPPSGTEFPPESETENPQFEETEPPPTSRADDKLRSRVNPCPDKIACDKLCKNIKNKKRGTCVGPLHNFCFCYK